MHNLQELISDNPGWPILQEWIKLAKNKTEILPVDRKKAEEALINIQLTTSSLMGAIVYETGGLLIDNGWIRIFGSGCERMKRSLPEWNKGKTFTQYGEMAPYLLVADDVIGGHYAINGGFFGTDRGNIYFNSPDSLDWEPLGIDYSQFLLFCFEHDLNDFYEGLRWKNWQEDVIKLHHDSTYIFTPYLWAKEGKEINTVTRKAVSAIEAYNVNMEIKSTLR